MSLKDTYGTLVGKREKILRFALDVCFYCSFGNKVWNRFFFLLRLLSGFIPALSFSTTIAMAFGHVCLCVCWWTCCRWTILYSLELCIVLCFLAKWNVFINLGFLWICSAKEMFLFLCGLLGGQVDVEFRCATIRTVNELTLPRV